MSEVTAFIKVGQGTREVRVGQVCTAPPDAGAQAWDPIKTAGECLMAAKAPRLGYEVLSDAEASSADPPFCYFKNGVVRLGHMDSTGACSATDVCICDSGERSGCAACPRGQWSAADAATACTPCAAGHALRCGN